MPKAILNQIIDQLVLLELKELQQLNQVIQRRLQSLDKRTKFHNALLTSGLVKRQSLPPNQQVPRQLIQVLGEPVSETIIQERR